MKKLSVFLSTGLWTCVLTLIGINTFAQQLYFPQTAASDTNTLPKTISILAKSVLTHYSINNEANHRDFLNTLFRLQIVATYYEQAIQSIDLYRKENLTPKSLITPVVYLQYELYSRSKLKERSSKQSFEQTFTQTFRDYFDHLDDKAATTNESVFLADVSSLKNDWQQILTKQSQSGKDSISLSEAIALCKSYFLYHVYTGIVPLAKILLAEQDNKRYTIQENVLLHTKEATIWAIIARQKNVTTPKPTALVYTIYAENQNVNQAKLAAAHGYIGIVAHTRGKGLSPDTVVPYEYESRDVYEVIDWISKQSWSNGQVGMYGGSYNGFSQWAATKKMHPALKTIVPYVAAIPGQGLPMENNVFLNANYGWAFYVSNNKYVDNSIYSNPQRWRKMMNEWYESGKPYHTIDSIDGAPNPWLQKWLKHPSYDAYWQSMVPYRTDFAKITIPVLTITGYYDDGQISALHYLKEHYTYNPNANHYLLIGPYDHFGAQRQGQAVLRGYTIDPVAHINTPEITFQWLDYIFYAGPKPALLKNKINYQVMGANIWRHAPSLDKMHNDMQTFYLTDVKSGDYYRLTTQKPAKPMFLSQKVDLVDRKSSNNDYYPDPIIRSKIDLSNGLAFISDPLSEPLSVNGTFLGELKASINKKDMDVGITLYELMPNGEFFHLSYFLGRASYAKDMTKRQLLQPNKIEAIPFERVRMVSRQLQKGSRLLVILNINKNPFAQINYGTGKDVSNESISDTQSPLHIKWYTDSFIKIPVWK